MPDAGEGHGLGKVILLGEHAVVYGHPALAAALDLGVHVRATRVARGMLRVPAWGLELRLDDEAAPARAMRAIAAELHVDPADVEIFVTGDLPARAGLGSSAALAVAVTRALAALAERPLSAEAVEAAAMAAERVFHGNPSGVDVALAARGGIGLFTRAEGLRPLASVPPIALCLLLSGEPRDTAARVADVARQRELDPATTDARLARLGELSRRGHERLAAGDTAALGPLFDAAQRELGALRLSTPRLDALCEQARSAGALGAKLTGAGGGGAVIALPRPGGAQALTAALGPDTRIVTVGASPS